MDKTQNNEDTHETNGSMSSFLCTICQEEFHSTQILEAHNIIAHENMFVKCKTCGKECPSERYLNAHMIINHGEQVRAENDFTNKVCSDNVEMKEIDLLVDIIEIGSEITIHQQGTPTNDDNILYIETNVESVEGALDNGIGTRNSLASDQIPNINGSLIQENHHSPNNLEQEAGGVISQKDNPNTTVLFIEPRECISAGSITRNTAEDLAAGSMENGISSQDTLTTNGDNSEPQNPSNNPELEANDVTLKKARNDVSVETIQTRLRTSQKNDKSTKILKVIMLKPKTSVQNSINPVTKGKNIVSSPQRLETCFCGVCGREFKNLQALISHSKTHSNISTSEKPLLSCVSLEEESSNINSPANLESDEPSKSKIKQHQCKFCQKKFHTAGRLKVHSRMHTGEKPYKCTVCNAQFAQYTNLKTHKTIHSEEKPFACDVCDKSFKTRSTLRDHSFTHLDQKPHQCDQCSKSFKRPSHLMLHLRKHFETNRGLRSTSRYACVLCDKSYADRSSLAKHKQKHAGKTYQCDMCDKSFSTSASCRDHKLVHGGKPYPCDQCSKSFRCPSHLEMHKKVHFGEKSYTCDVCGKTFFSKGGLRLHLDDHKGKSFSCKICGSSYTRSSSLNIHMSVHTGEKPYTCDLCGMSFRLSETLKKHMVTHTGVKAFQCDVCQKRFSRKEALLRHSRMHSGKKTFQCEICTKSFFRKDCLLKHETVHNT